MDEQALRPPLALRWLVFVAYFAAWSCALLTRRPPLPGWVPQSQHYLFLFSKAVHVGGYTAFLILGGWLMPAGGWRWPLLAFLSAHAFGSEYLQYLLPTGRIGSWQDVVLDHAAR